MLASLLRTAEGPHQSPVAPFADSPARATGFLEPLFEQTVKSGQSKEASFDCTHILQDPWEVRWRCCGNYAKGYFFKKIGVGLHN